jgi:hypothetical protein
MRIASSLSLSIAVLCAAVARGDESAPPPPLPSAQTPAAKITVQADSAPAAANPQVITLHVVPTAPAPAPPQTVTVQLVPTAAATAPATVAPLAVRHPGPLRRAIGNFGDRLSRVGKTSWIAVPTAQYHVQQVNYTVTSQPAQAEVAPSSALASPQAARRTRFGF